MKKLAAAILSAALLASIIGTPAQARGRATPNDLGWCHGPCPSAVQR